MSPSLAVTALWGRSWWEDVRQLQGVCCPWLRWCLQRKPLSEICIPGYLPAMSGTANPCSLWHETGHCGPAGVSSCLPQCTATRPGVLALTSSPCSAEANSLPKLSFFSPGQFVSPLLPLLLAKGRGRSRPCSPAWLTPSCRKDRPTLKPGRNFPISRMSFSPGQKPQSKKLSHWHHLPCSCTKSCPPLSSCSVGLDLEILSPPTAEEPNPAQTLAPAGLTQAAPTPRPDVPLAHPSPPAAPVTPW